MTDRTPPHDDMDWPDQHTAHDLLKLVFEHYNLHHEIVMKKLGHAQKATALSGEDAPQDKRADLAGYNSAWIQIIDLFKTCGITEEELFEIENILSTLPDTIRVHFERLVKLDQMLQKLMLTLEKMDYYGAMEKINAIQSRPNPMSGLSREDYNEGGNSAREVKVYSFLPKRK